MILEDNCLQESIKKLFDVGGLIPSVFPQYSYREGQVRLAEEIWKSMKKGEVLLAEAPTGIGKTLALLIPSILAAKEGKKIVYVTSTRNLQDQIMAYHLPKLEQIFDGKVAYGTIKGRNNYVCYRKAEHELRNAGTTTSFKLDSWLKSTFCGEVDEIAALISGEVASALAISQEDCLGSRCPFRGECFFLKLVKRAQNWDLVVTNYHFFLSHLIGAGGKFVVPVDILIFDEAHKMPEVARSVASVKVGYHNFQKPMSSILSKVVPFLAEKGYVNVDRFVKNGKKFLELGKELFMWLGKSYKPGQVLEGPLYSESLLRLKGEYSVISNELRKITDEDNFNPEESPYCLEALELFEGLKKAFDNLSWCIEFANFPSWAYWWDGSHLVSAPASVAEVLQESFENLAPHSIIGVSATLALNGDFSYWQRETNLVADRTVVIDSPFELEKQMQIWVVETNKKVTDLGYEETIAKIVEHLCDENGGRSLVLLSSLSLLGFVGEYMKSRAKKYNIYVQKETPLSKLVASFKEDLTSVLIGSVTFREGFDVPGEGLTQVIIDRIPFDHPEDPMMKTLKVLFGRAYFRSFVLPRAKLILKQAAGRLIRTERDRGRVVILDGRVLSRKDWKIYDCLPKVPYKKIKLA